MRERKSINLIQLTLYLFLGIFALFLRQIGNYAEPFSLPLCFGMASAQLHPLLCAVIYLITAMPPSFEVFLLYFGQAVLLYIGFFLQKKFLKTEFLKTGILPLFALSLSLGLFFAFSPFEGYALPISGLNITPLLQKGLLSAFLFLLSAIFSVSMKALIHKLFHCRLRDDEIVFSLLCLVLVGVGACRFLSVNAYMGVSFFILLLYAVLVKDTSTLVCAFLLSLPPFLVAGVNPARFFLYGIAITLFMRSGRIAAICALLAVFFSFGYVDGLYAYPTNLLLLSLLSALLPCLLFILIPLPLLRNLEHKLVFYREKHLSRIAINRNRVAIGEKLFEISAVFREIETTFVALSAKDGDESVREFICTAVQEEICANCPQRDLCENKGSRYALNKLIEIGTMKGKANLIDVPSDLCALCINQSGLLYAVNRQLVDYRKFQLESENAAQGRELLANQAQGISEILKNLALEQSEPLRLYTDKENALNLALLRAGIVCSEVLIYGDEDAPTLSLITFGKADVKKIAAVASHLFACEMMISERLALAQDKFCCILRKKPFFDAAFGVSSVKKEGEIASGDTHSVIKIDESKFMVALSDGMGSGEYAQRISETTISLLESFYRAKMPSELVLSTINKLLTFNHEETFACVDIAVVDLNSGKADIVKIGAPVGFILSGNTVKVLENASLPLGILDSVRPDAGEYTLCENDVLLFISDGISDAFGSTADLYEVLRTIPLRNPQQLTDCLLEQALQATSGKAKDDMTAVAVRLFKNLAVS
ncbi:MAG: SpoIIE family protein phosphatase [Clostridia bacterium]|nr:SpoIIE family protein phosphatase [Clostridia bacterium]